MLNFSLLSPNVLLSIVAASSNGISEIQNHDDIMVYLSCSRL